MIANFSPENSELKFDIMNLLESRLKHASSSVLLGAVKVFINITKDDEFLTKEVYERLSSPLITLMTSAETTDSYEICYAVLAHIYFIIERGAFENFQSAYKHFFLKYDEPSYCKFLKLKILALIATDDTVEEICTELNEYVTDVNHEVAKRSIRCFGRIIINLPDSASKVATLIQNFLALQTSYLTTECMLVL